MRSRTTELAVFPFAAAMLAVSLAHAGEHVPGPAMRLSWMSVLTIGAVVALLLMAAQRGGRRLASTVIGAAGLLLLFGVGSMLVYRLRTMDSATVEVVEAWPPMPPGPYSASHPPYDRPMESVRPESPFARYDSAPIVAVAPSSSPPVAEIVSGIPEELSPAPAANSRKPDWVESPPALQADGVYRVAVSAGPHEPTDPESQRALTRELQRAVRDYIEADRGAGAAERVAYTSAEVRKFVKAEWNEPYQSETPGLGPMVRRHAWLAFDDAARRDMEMRLERSLAAGRLKIAGGAAGALLASLAALFGYLKLDTLTRGYYRARLKTAAVAVILAATAAVALLVS